MNYVFDNFGGLGPICDNAFDLIFTALLRAGVLYVLVNSDKAVYLDEYLTNKCVFNALTPT